MEPQEVPIPEHEPTPPPRRRGRTATLIASAAALGVLGGVCTGYVVQAGGAPTPLPALAQPVVAQAEGKAPDPLSAAQDRLVKTDGDLRKLLLKKPAGAKDWPSPPGNDGWMSLMTYADGHGHPGDAFRNLLDSGFRRIAVRSWTESNGLDVEIRLVQFREESQVASLGRLKDQLGFARLELAPGDVVTPVHGALDGGLAMYGEPEREAGYVPRYKARALMRRGDIHLEMWFVRNGRPVSEKQALSLAEKQLERL
ncbi:hypothetical protein [Streptomyces sp. NPDC002994]|uniref:hypothetical protein n=1 Tax=Streptomyces sp. NPDC002994 TaxID=3154441 RepID=UPI0033AFADE3